MVQEPAQTIESLLGSWVENPTTRSDGSDALLVGFGKERYSASGQV